MSYILDALKRSEAERERERGTAPSLHGQAQLVIDPAEDEVPVVPPLQAGRLIGLGVLLAALLAGVGWWLWTPGPAPTAPVAAATPSATPPAMPAPVPMVQPIAVAPPPPMASSGASGLPGTVSEPAPPPPPRLAETSRAPQPGLDPGNPDRLAPAPRPPPALPPAQPRESLPPTASPVVPPPAARQPAGLPLPGAPEAAPAISSRQPPAPKAAEPRAAAEPAPRAGAPRMAELPASLRGQLPPLKVSGSVYSPEVPARMLILDGQILRQGQNVSPDLLIEQIGPKSAVLSFRGQRFELPYGP